MRKLLFLLLLLLSAKVEAQDKPVVDWADKTSYATAATSPSASLIEAVRGESKKCDLLKLGLKEVLANGVGITIKHFVVSPRPCLGCPPDGMPSGHTWNSFIGNDWRFALSFGITTGVLRHTANRHTWKQVAAGALLGVGSDVAGELIMNRLAVCGG
jgi:hypothetical protein